MDDLKAKWKKAFSSKPKGFKGAGNKLGTGDLKARSYRAGDCPSFAAAQLQSAITDSPRPPPQPGSAAPAHASMMHNAYVN